MKSSNQNRPRLYKRALNGFAIKTRTSWEPRHVYWQIEENGKNYIIFKYTDDKKIFKQECAENIIRGLSQARAIKMLLTNGVSEEEISCIGNNQAIWDGIFVDGGGGS